MKKKSMTDIKLEDLPNICIKTNQITKYKFHLKDLLKWFNTSQPKIKSEQEYSPSLEKLIAHLRKGATKEDFIVFDKKPEINIISNEEGNHD